MKLRHPHAKESEVLETPHQVSQFARRAGVIEMSMRQHDAVWGRAEPFLRPRPDDARTKRQARIDPPSLETGAGYFAIESLRDGSRKVGLVRPAIATCYFFEGRLPGKLRHQGIEAEITS